LEASQGSVIVGDDRHEHIGDQVVSRRRLQGSVANMSGVVCDVDYKTEKSVNEILPSPRGTAQASV